MKRGRPTKQGAARPGRLPPRPAESGGTADRRRHGDGGGVSGQEARSIDERQRLRAPVVYEIVRQEGEDELARPVSSLWWSGLAAGIAISISVVAEGLLHARLPESDWRPLIENFGYCIGFLIVILGRLQLFTENTITVVLPLAVERSAQRFRTTARLWAIVLTANLVGTFAFAAAAHFTGIFSAEQIEAFREISQHLMTKTPWEMLMHAVPAGFLVAALVWMLPCSHGSEFWVILIITYVIALGDFAHVIAGSAEAFLMLLGGGVTLTETAFGFLLPALIGNVIGGTALFAVLAYAQVMEEL